MSRRLAVTAATLLAALSALGAAGAAAASPGAQEPTSGYSLAQVQQLADASPSFSVVTAPVQVSPSAAYATAAEPGATVEGAPLSAAASAVANCWEGDYAEQWGIWPLYQKVISHDTWCSTNWSHLYYHTNYATTAQVVCSAYTPFHDRVAGGTSGQMTDEWEVGARFSCPTNLPGISYNPTRAFYIVVAADGGYYHG